MNKLITWMVLAALLVVVCSQRSNPLDEKGDDYVPPALVLVADDGFLLDSSTIHIDTATLNLEGNNRKCRFRTSLDNDSWSDWQDTGLFYFTSLTEGEHTVAAEVKYSGGNVVTDTSFSFTVAIEGYVVSFANSAAVRMFADTAQPLLLVSGVSGEQPIDIQWYKDSSAIDGETDDTLTIDAFTAGDTGSYYAVAWNAYGMDTGRVTTVERYYPNGTVLGTIYDKKTGKSLSGKKVTMPLFELETMSDSVGMFMFNILYADTYQIVFNSMGYSDVMLEVVVDTDSSTINVDSVFLEKTASVECWYTVVYNEYGATSGGAPVDTVRYVHGSEVKVMGKATLKKKGNTFMGWCEDTMAVEKLYPADSMLTIDSSNVTLYAVWSINTYMVSYNGGEHTEGIAPLATKHEFGTTIKVPSAGTLEKEGHVFYSWNSVEEGGGFDYTEGSEFIVPDEDTELHARWTTGMFSIYYESGEHTFGEPPPVQNFLYGSVTLISGNTGGLKIYGYHFDGWNTSVDGSGTPFDVDTQFLMPGRDLRVYAQWKKNEYTVIFDAAGGGAVEEQDVIHGEYVQMPVVPQKIGNIFIGWYKDTLFLELWKFSGDTVVSDVALYAKWWNPQSSMVCIPSMDSTFSMGSTIEKNEKPIHPVKFTYDFMMGSTETTIWQYYAVMKSLNPNFKQKTNWNLLQNDEYPVFDISWNEAVAFCNAMTIASGSSDTAYSYETTPANGVNFNVVSSGFRLPTEAEWEYAYRAGTTTSYYWGSGYNGEGFSEADTLLMDANAVWIHNANDLIKLTPIGKTGISMVAQKNKNPFGLYDMSGNVLEFCFGKYTDGYMGIELEVDPVDAFQKDTCVARGGCWYQGADGQRAAKRYIIRSALVHNYMSQGFRICRTLK